MSIHASKTKMIVKKQVNECDGNGQHKSLCVCGGV